MDRNNVAIRRSLTAAGRIALCAASILVASALPATAAQLEQHNDLVNRYVTTMHADPLVADCAAHGAFIASTSSVIDHVEFTPQSFDSTHATVTPWNDSFDEGKQRVKVDTVVSVKGTGIRQDSSAAPLDLTFRCGYVGNQMLAFSWNDPQPPARARSERSTARAGASVHGTHIVKGKSKGKGKGKGKAAVGKNRKKSLHKQNVRRQSAHKPSSAGAARKGHHHATKAVKKAPAKKKKSSR